MKIATNNSFLGKIMDFSGINKLFHKYEQIKINNHATIISPVEAKVAHIGKINFDGNIISKNNKKINLKLLIGKYSQKFCNGAYINFYLNPNNKHFWVIPCDGNFIYTQKNEGKSKLPAFIGLENLFGIEMFSKAVKRNASIGSVLQTKNSLIAMIAVGSLNVNRIHIDYEKGIKYQKGTPCGYFSLGSSMLLCFSNHENFSIKQGDLIKIGEKLK